MNACPGCREAETGNTAIYYMACNSCDARAAASSDAAKDALLGHPQALQALLRKLFPTPESYRAGRVETHRWIKMMSEARSKA